MEAAKRCKIPAFGDWNSFDDDIPISKYFESTTTPVSPIHRDQYFRPYISGDLLLAPLPTPVKPGRRIKKRERRRLSDKIIRRQRRVHDAKEEEEQHFSPKNEGRIMISSAAKAPVVDEDLYKIPPEEFLYHYQKPKLKNLIRSMWTWCMGINSIF